MEYLQGHVPGAVLIPMSQLTSRLGEVPRTARCTSSAAAATAAPRWPRSSSAPASTPTRCRRHGCLDALRSTRRHRTRAGRGPAALTAGRPAANARSDPHAHPRSSRDGHTILPVETPSLGDRSYLVHDGEVALRRRPAARHRPHARPRPQRGVRITHVFETHIHNDYVTGGFALAQRDRRRLPRQRRRPGLLRAPPGARRRRRRGQRLPAGAGPAHPGPHLHPPVVRRSRAPAPAVFSGGSLLFGSTGRPDLLGPEHTDTLARHQHASAHRLAAQLSDDTQVMPTHGFGSFCSATQSSTDVVHHRPGAQGNPALTTDEQAYVARDHRRAGRLPRLLRPHGPGQRRRARPAPT